MPSYSDSFVLMSFITTSGWTIVNDELEVVCQEPVHSVAESSGVPPENPVSVPTWESGAAPHARLDPLHRGVRLQFVRTEYTFIRSGADVTELLRGISLLHWEMRSVD
jgi:hypothetical protein